MLILYINYKQIYFELALNSGVSNNFSGRANLWQEIFLYKKEKMMLLKIEN